ncbi:MAG: hypothetical protein OFPI_24730 [Osedax symbiont Rs2]|nr:MAG: hypothetical protein OFPI_24730 [Osedax symbiont Rs2]
MNSRRQWLSLWILSLSVATGSGCQFISIEKATFIPQDPIHYTAAAEPIFNPNGKEVFSLKAKPKILQKNGYVRFCQNTVKLNCKNKLPYLRFLGMRGYFDSSAPTKTDHKSYEFYPVVMQNGDKYFFLSLKNTGGKYGVDSPIKLVSLGQNFDKSPIAEASKITLVAQYRSFDSIYYTLSNGAVIERQQLQYIRDISANYSEQAQISELLLNTSIEKSELYNNYFISPKNAATDTGIKLIIGLSEQRQWLRLKISHRASQQLHFNGYSIVADELLWRSPPLAFSSKQSEKQYNQWFEISANQQEVKIVKALAAAGRGLIRFHGPKKSVYKLLKGHDKQHLADSITLFALLQRNES